MTEPKQRWFYREIMAANPMGELLPPVIALFIEQGTRLSVAVVGEQDHGPAFSRRLALGSLQDNGPQRDRADEVFVFPHIEGHLRVGQAIGRAFMSRNFYILSARRSHFRHQLQEGPGFGVGGGNSYL